MVNLAMNTNDFLLKVKQGSDFNVDEAENCGELVKLAFDVYKQFMEQDLGRHFSWNVPERIYGSKMLWGKAPVLSGMGEIVYDAVDWLQRFTSGKKQVEDAFGSPFGYVFQDKTGRIYVVFRGTLNNSEWYNNVFAGLQPWKNRLGDVHWGFLDIYNSFKNDLIAVLKEFLNSSLQCKEIYFTGHSLGGALSTMAMLDVLDEIVLPMNPQQRPKMVQYALGAPRVGDKEFADRFKRTDVSLKCYQVVDIKDLVPNLPIEGVKMDPLTFWYGLDKTGLSWVGQCIKETSFSGLYVNHGELIEFSSDKGSVSNNHDLFETYCEVLRPAK